MEEGLPCQLEKWNFIWMNRRAAQREWGRMGSGVTAGRINDKKPPDRISEGSQGGVLFFCGGVKRNPCSI